MTIAQYIDELRQSSDECIDNSEPVRVPAAFAPGDMLPQGDIGLQMLDQLPSSWREDTWPAQGDLQLAPGQSKGSRHMIARKFATHIRIFRIDDGDALSDLGIEASEPFDLTHPEHADHLGYPAGVYRVRHQQNEQRERVID